ncbi:CheY-like chemotaxis protein [Oxalobacteraceae bacterium GrIS 2.11]
MTSQTTPMAQFHFTVLVVDDDFMMQRVTAGILNSLGHTGVIVENGALAIECLSQREFDLVLLDVMMPVMDGLETLATIRGEEKLSGKYQPIIMLTGHAEPSDAQRLKQAGADGYISKPVNPDQLKFEMNRVMFHLSSN